MTGFDRKMTVVSSDMVVAGGSTLDQVDQARFGTVKGNH